MDLPLVNRMEEKGSLLNRTRLPIGEGRPLDETTWSKMECLMGHDLKEVRVHDSRQAGELASRLGGEAFTAGRHMLGPYGKLAASTSEATGLLAREIAHVAQQAKPRELAWASQPDRVLAVAPASCRTPAPAAISAAKRLGKPLPSAEEQASRSKGGQLQFSSSPDMHGEAIQRQGEELQALAAEQAVREAVQTAPRRGAPSEATPQPEPERIADMVYGMMLRDLVIERERRCWLKSRLP